MQTRMPGTPVTTVFYLHGFASSSKSTKAGYFAERLGRHGIVLQCPDFNQPDFATMTITRMLQQISAAAALERGAIALMGSSLGGALAVLAAVELAHRIDRLVLMAPAVMFAKAGHHLLPPERIEQWRRLDALPFFHHAYNEERLLNFSFYEDSLRHDAFESAFSQPTLIFQGLHDASVDYRTVEAFANGRRNVTLSLLNDDHQLIASLPRMWSDVAPFFGLAE
jgi:pimeloyl-ACP methyl ester carboxylesterase